MPNPPTGATDCKPCVPILNGERVPLLFPERPKDCRGQNLPADPAGDWWQYVASTAIEFAAYNCGLIVVPQIPEDYIDLLLTFDNRVWGRAVSGEHLIRLVGTFRRIDDEYAVERYVTARKLEGDIYRGYRRRYEVEVLILSPCALWGFELAKFAKKIQVKTRTGLVREVDNLVPEDLAINDKGAAIKATLRLREEVYRQEYRY